MFARSVHWCNGDLMDSSEISEDVRNFIVRRIDSVPHLEALLLLWELPSKRWAEAEIASRVYISRERAGLMLQDLVRHGLIACSSDSAGYFQYEPSWDEARVMPKVAATYRRQLVGVATLIHAKSSSEAVRQFAQAFKLKSDAGE